MKYLKPEMDIVEFDEDVMTDINVNGSTDNIEDGDIPSINETN